FTQARSALDRCPDEATPERSWLEARWQLGAGSAQTALDVLDRLDPKDADEELSGLLRACRGRALLGVGKYGAALEVLAEAESFPGRARIEALAYRGLAQALLGQREEALVTLEQALREAEGTRIEALVASSFATALWRAERLDEAATQFRRAIEAAER